MRSGLRLYLRTGLIAIGIMLGPDMLFAVMAAVAKMVNEHVAWDKILIVMPLMLAMVSCALWALIVGHWYVRAWFISLSVVWNLWGMLDVLNQAKEPFEYTFALPWIVWSAWFSFRFVQYAERVQRLKQGRQ